MAGLWRCLVLFASIALTLLSSLSCSSAAEQAIIKGQESTEEQVNQGGKYVAIPNNPLSRFLLYHARPMEHQSNGLIGYKRSSSNLDALSGMTLGKRSIPMDYLNMEPYYGRHFGMRSVPRMYDLRWAPLDSYETPVVAGELN